VSLSFRIGVQGILYGLPVQSHVYALEKLGPYWILGNHTRRKEQKRNLKDSGVRVSGLGFRV